MNRRSLFLFLGSALVILSGCAQVDTVKKTTDKTDAISRDTSNYIANAQRVESKGDDNVTIHDSGFYVPLRAINRTKADPAALKCRFGYNPIEPVTLNTIAKRVQDQCHVPIRITSDAQQLLAGTFGQRGNAAAPANNAPATSTPPPLVPALTNGLPNTGAAYGAAGTTLARRDLVSVSYDGDLRGFLDTVTGQLGLSWRYDDAANVATIFYVESRTFVIAAISADTSFGSSVQSGATSTGGNQGGGSGGGSSGSGGIAGNSTSSTTSEVTSKSSISNDIKASVDGELTPGVGMASPISGSTGTITVTDTPEALDRIGTMLDKFNARLTKQMRFNVVIVSYIGSHGTDGSINWNALYSNLAKNFNVGIASAYQAGSAATNATINVLNGSTHWSASQAVISALNEQGTATAKTETPISTLNLQAASVQVAESQVYLSSSSVTGGTTTGSATQSALQPGTFTVGYSLQMRPYVLQDDKNILLQFNVNLSALKQLRKITAAGSSIEAPDINQRVIQNMVRLKVGQTLLLSGFQQTSLSVNRQGTGLPGIFNYAFGGGANTSNSKETLIVLITPTAID